MCDYQKGLVVLTDFNKWHKFIYMNKYNNKIVIQQMDALWSISSYVTSMEIVGYTYHLSSYINSLVKNQNQIWKKEL